MSNNYENAPATLFLATHCAVCRRPLLDSISVETGMGPICRQSHGYDEAVVTAEEQASANAIISRVARKGVTEDDRAAACAALRLMGFAKLADRIEYRGKDAPKSATVTVAEFHLPGLPGRRGYGGRWLPALPPKTGYLVRAPYKPSSVPAFRELPGRVWLADQKANFVPTSSKRALWNLLSAHYSGLTLVVVKDEQASTSMIPLAA